MSDELTDAQLWDAITSDDLRAFNKLYKRYWEKLFTNAYFYVNESDACEEIVQDIFIYLWNKRKELKITSFSRYLAASVKYKALNHLRAGKTSRLSYIENIEDISKASCLNKGDENIRKLEFDQQINSYLDILPNRCKEIFVMSRINHLSNDEIAARLNISKRTVENQITQALKQLRLSFKDAGFLFLLLAIFKGY